MTKSTEPIRQCSVGSGQCLCHNKVQETTADHACGLTLCDREGKYFMVCRYYLPVAKVQEGGENIIDTVDGGVIRILLKIVYIPTSGLDVSTLFFK